MSQLQSVRVRSQRTAAAAVERARLSLVPNSPSRAPRAPFAVLVALVLGLGVVGLLMFNTHMQQASIAATKLEDQRDALQARSEALTLKLERQRDPQQVAVAARKLGMVTPPVPATLDLSTGEIRGVPTAATHGDYTRFRPNRTPVPCFSDPCGPRIVKVRATPTAPPAPTAPTAPTANGQTGGGTGPASGGSGAPTGINAEQAQTVDSARGESR